MTKRNLLNCIIVLFLALGVSGAEKDSGLKNPLKEAADNKEASKYNFDLKKIKEELDSNNPLQTGTDNKKARKKQSTTKSLVLYSIRMIIYLAVLTFIIIMLLKYLKSKKFTIGKKGLSERFVEVLETSHIGPKQSIGLIKIMNRVIMVGITENNINLLGELERETEASIILKNKSDAANVVSGQFSTTINSFLDKFKKEEINKVSDYEK